MDNEMTPPEFNQAAEPDPFEKLKQYREKKVDFGNDLHRLNKWSWGAFGFGWIWGAGNRTYIMLLGLIPGVNLVMAIIGGLKGNRWAYKNGDWKSVDEYMRAQRSWETAGMIEFFLGLGILVFYVVILILFGFTDGLSLIL